MGTYQIVDIVPVKTAHQMYQLRQILAGKQPRDSRGRFVAIGK